LGSGSRRQADRRPQGCDHRENDVTGGTVGYFPAGTAPRAAASGADRKFVAGGADVTGLHSALARCRLQQGRNGTPRRSGVPGRVGPGRQAASARRQTRAGPL